MTFLFVVWAFRINFFLFEGHIGDNALVCVVHSVIIEAMCSTMLCNYNNIILFIDSHRLAMQYYML